MNDYALVDAVRHGNEEAFRRLFDDFFPKLYRFSLSRVDGDHDTAEEVARSTLCRALEHLDGYQGDAALSTWLFTICRNELIELRRTRRTHGVRFAKATSADEVHTALESLQGLEPNTPQFDAHRHEMQQAVQLALDYLPAHYSRLLQARYFENLSVDNVSTAVTTVASIEDLLTQAHAAFRDAFRLLAPTRRPRE